jgi:predicted PurR-regulated permease PerM
MKIKKRCKEMKTTNLNKKISIWAVVIAGVLAIPFITRAPWTLGDYFFAGIVLSILATIYEAVTKKMHSTKQKLIVAAIVLGIIVLIIGWAATGPD